MRKLGWLFMVGGLLSGCGTTVGDPCTTESECGDGICLNRDFTPGGYCTKACTLGVDNNCPNGSTCIADAVSNNLAGCLRTCNNKNDCRAGYECRQVGTNTPNVCVGPTGI